jgi:hypothetical protein
VRQDGKQSDGIYTALARLRTCTIRSGTLFLKKCSRFLELIGSFVVSVPADYTRYLRTNCIYDLGVLGGIVKHGGMFVENGPLPWSGQLFSGILPSWRARRAPC